MNCEIGMRQEKSSESKSVLSSDRMFMCLFIISKRDILKRYSLSEQKNIQIV